jgi:uncharacterized membrane protein
MNSQLCLKNPHSASRYFGQLILGCRSLLRGLAFWFGMTQIKSLDRHKLYIMSTSAICLMVGAIVLPHFICLIYAFRHLLRHEEPDRARLNIMRGLLCYIVLLMAANAVALLIFWRRGNFSHSTAVPLLPLISLSLLFTIVTVQIQLCQRRLRKSGA